MSTTPNNQWVQKVLAVLVCASMLLGTTAARSYNPVPQEPQPTTEAQATTSQAQIDALQSIDPERVDFHQIVVKFSEATTVRLSASGLSSAAGVDLSPVTGLLQGFEVKRLFSQPVEVLDQKRQEAVARGDAQVVDLNQYYLVQLPDSVTFETARDLVGSLLQQSIVATAYMEPRYVLSVGDLPPITDNMTAEQGYLAAAPAGVDALYAHQSGQTGGTGLNVQVLDIEHGWQLDHEDLNITGDALIESANGSQLEWINHGTAVLGVIAGFKNSYGIEGIAPDAQLRMVSDLGRPLADAINLAALNSQPGDVIVLPLALLGPRTGATCSCSDEECAQFETIPVEYTQANYDAILAATQLGINVVESAGNGASNLDSSVYGDAFNRNVRNSGALLVGAGAPDTHEPMCSSNFGRRVDLQGWGSGIVTTGYGDRFDGDSGSGPDPRQFYTSQFGGTSGATAMVAGVTASLQGIAKRRGYLLTPGQMRSVLITTGTAQGGDATNNHIGPLPNLRSAIDNNLASTVRLLTPENDSTVYTLRPTLNWEDYLGATGYQLQVAKTSTFNTIVLDTTVTASEYTFTSNLSTNTAYYWRVKPFLTDASRGFSAPFRFTIVASTVPAVSLLKPENKAVTIDFTPEFTWKSPSIDTAFDGFQIQLSKDSDFPTGSTIDAFTGANSYTPATDLDTNSLYYWHVRSYKDDVDSGDRYFSAWTARRVLYTTLMPTTLDTPTLDTLRPTFTWTEMASARAYELQISKQDTFAKLVTRVTVNPASGSTVPPLTYTFAKDLPRSSTLFARLRVRGLYGWSDYSNAVTFDTGNPPSTPVLLSPANKAVNRDLMPILKWSHAARAPESYQIQISDNKDFASPVVDDVVAEDPTTTPEYEASGLMEDTLYYWRVRSQSADGFYSNWTGMRILYTTPSAPASLTNPGDPTDSLQPVLEWEPVETARSYWIQIAKSDTFSKTSIVANVVTKSSPPFALPVALPRGTTLYWRVAAGGQFGYSVFSDFDQFSTPNPPAAPGLLSPADLAVLQTFNPVLDWTNSPTDTKVPDRNPVGYQVQVSSSPIFSDTSTLVDATTTVSTFSINGEVLPNAGRYYWHVRAYNANNEYSAWTSTWSFDTPAIIRGVVTDALTGDPLQYANVQVSGTTLSTTTNDLGEYTLRGILPGGYRVTVAAVNYIRQSVAVYVNTNTNRTQDIQVAAVPDDGTIRIVVSWAKTPNNLDAHLWLPQTNKFHVYKNNMGDLAGDEHAQLYMDDTDGYGPEIIDIDQLYAGTYQFAVFASGASSAILTSDARVVVYDGATLVGSYTVPTTGDGNWWKVFSINGSTRKLTGQNVLLTSSPAPYPEP